MTQSGTPSGNGPSRRAPWILVGGVAALLVLGLCMVVLTVGSFFVLTRDRGEISAGQRTQVFTRPTPTPFVAPGPIQVPADVVDYETAVLTAIYEKVNPSVVYIEVLVKASDLPTPPSDLEDPDSLVPEGQGSGFVWDTEGHIVTNAHVAQDAEQILVRFWDGTATVAEVVGIDLHSDLAVIKVDPEGYTLIPVERGNLDEMRPGMRVAAIGNPFGLEGSMTAGIISAIGRSIPGLASFNIPEAIQTDAPINPGNSGGPLVNERGQVIGVNAQIRSTQLGANSGVGFAIPITIVERVVPVLIREGSYEHAFIGISGTTYSPICAEDLDLPKDVRGAYVVEVLEGTPAARAGLRGGSEPSHTRYVGVCPEVKGGDLIIAIDGQPVTRFDDLLVYLERYTSPGDTIVLTVLRDGRTLDIEVTLAARPRSLNQ